MSAPKTAPKTALCGIDIGSTAIKVLFVDEAGQVLASHGLPCPLYTGAGGVAEQDAEDWYRLAARCVRACAEESSASVAAISISAQAGCLVAADAAGVPMGRALSWMDERAAGLKTALDDREVYRASGWRWRAGFNAAKLLWMRQNRPGIFGKAAFFLSTIDYVNLRLCGLPQGLAIDPSSAALTQLYDLDAGDWNGEMLAQLGAEKSRLPRILPSGGQVGALCARAARDCGLPQGTPVVSGGHDQYCAAAGAGALNGGDLLISMGTAWAVLAISETRITDYAGWAAGGSHVAAGRYGLMTSLTAGGALEWLRRTALPGVPLDEIDKTAKNRRDKNINLFCLPYFSGVSYPYWQDDARACFVGLGLEHDACDMALALMEGAAFDVKAKLDGYTSLGSAPEKLRLAGGGAKSQLWTGILQAVCGIPALRCQMTEAAALGATALAGVWAGVWPGLGPAAARFGQQQPCVPPTPQDVDYYAEKYRRYSGLYGQIRQFYTEG